MPSHRMFQHNIFQSQTVFEYINIRRLVHWFSSHQMSVPNEMTSSIWSGPQSTQLATFCSSSSTWIMGIPSLNRLLILHSIRYSRFTVDYSWFTLTIQWKSRIGRKWIRWFWWMGSDEFCCTMLFRFHMFSFTYIASSLLVSISINSCTFGGSMRCQMNLKKIAKLLMPLPVKLQLNPRKSLLHSPHNPSLSPIRSTLNPLILH